MRFNSAAAMGKLLRMLAVMSLVLLAACGDSATPTTATTATNTGGKLQVVSTTTQIRSMAQSVAGDLADVSSILVPGADAHSFEPRPSDVQAISASAVVLRNGVGLDNWLDNLIANAGGQKPIYTVTDGVQLREGEEDEQGGQDPHVWFSVSNAMTMTRNIALALATVDPTNATAYQTNADAYLKTLTNLDNYIMQQVASVPAANRKMVTNHDAFGYYIDRYGLQFVGSIIPSLSSEAEPSAQDVADLIAKIKAENVKAIFLESSINPALASQVANDAGVKVVDTLYGDSLGDTGTPGETYEGMMRFNTDTIVAALK